MKKKKLIIATLLLSFGMAVLASQLNPVKGLFSVESQVHASSKIPTHILYDQLFRVIVSFRRKAEIQRLTGKNVTKLPNYIKESANLTDEENEKLTQFALEFMESVEVIDAHALDLIAQIREEFPDGEVGEGQQISPPPAELTDLQNQRNDLALSYRDKISKSFSKESFEAFDEYMHKEFIKGFQTTTTNPRN